MEHIVLSGGALLGLYELGALHKLYDCNVIDINKIKSVYGTSVGSIFGTILCLKLKFDIGEE